MMSTSNLFQDFGTLKPANAGNKSMSAEEIEDLKLHSFESGFQAGWEEALKAQAETSSHVSEGLAASLKSASFEYQELRDSLQTAVQAIMSEVVDTVLPLTARASLGAHICDQIKATTQDALDRSIEIVVSSGREATVHDVLNSELSESFRVIVDPMLSPNQACLRLGSKEIDMDLDKTVAEIASAVGSFFETQQTEVNDG
ncbi:MAG: hypothetical protein ABJ360_03000 [Roseobacter sp.]|uniref:FliH/SctL family protein n=2 Tax=Tateyamaria sp. TaxID=1929288 RepID=UPI003274D01F